MINIINTLESLLDDNKVIYEYSADNTAKKLDINIFDVERFVKVNECKEITNPILFARPNLPTSDGLLSNEIFGMTTETRSGIFGYIDLSEYFIDPSIYKALCRVDKRINAIIHGTNSYSIDDNGHLIDDPEGNTGIIWFKKNFDKIVFKRTGSRDRDERLKYINYGNKNNLMFIKKYIVIPPAYRDTNTSNGKVGVGGINKLYQSLLQSVRSLKETQDFGLDASNMICGRIQDILVAIYDFFSGNSNNMIKDPGTGISGKTGILRRANMTKTSDYSSRLVLSAPELKVETVDDLMVDLDHAAIPLAAVCADFYPYMIFNIRRFFENEFQSGKYSVVDKDGNITLHNVKDYQKEFSDERIKAELKNYLKGYSNRFKPVTVTLEDGTVARMKFIGYKTDPKNHNKLEESITKRDLTWLDIIYQAAIESTKDKMTCLTRFPIDSRFNQFFVGINVSSTKDIEPMIINDTYYPFYPKFRQEDIGRDTSNMFVDTMQICNLYLEGVGGD